MIGESEVSGAQQVVSVIGLDVPRTIVSITSQSGLPPTQ